jgi:hypothetical protein
LLIILWAVPTLDYADAENAERIEAGGKIREWFFSRLLLAPDLRDRLKL